MVASVWKLSAPDGGVNLKQLAEELGVAGYFYSCMYTNRHWTTVDGRRTFELGDYYVGVRGTVPSNEEAGITAIVNAHVAEAEVAVNIARDVRINRIDTLKAKETWAEGEMEELLRLVAGELR
jgi:hypothetical protein